VVQLCMMILRPPVGAKRGAPFIVTSGCRSLELQQHGESWNWFTTNNVSTYSSSPE